MRKIVCVTTLLCLFSTNTIADTLKSENDLKGMTDKVMEKASKGEFESAFKIMEPYVVISQAEFQSGVYNSRAQRDQYATRYGKSVGYEFISSKKVGESLVRLVYIEKTEKHALPWAFFFYKTSDGWVLNSFTWNDQMPVLFQAN